MDSNDIPEVVIDRDWETDDWVYVGTGAHGCKVGFKASAPFDRVARFLKDRANGKIRVRAAWSTKAF